MENVMTMNGLMELNQNEMEMVEGGNWTQVLGAIYCVAGAAVVIAAPECAWAGVMMFEWGCGNLVA